MEEKEVKQLLLNQKIHKLELFFRWLAQDTNKLNEEINKATLSFKDFSKAYKQATVH